jgi:hypothetical protein
MPSEKAASVDYLFLRLRAKLRLKIKAPKLKRLVAGFPPRRPGFKSGSSHVGFVGGQSGAGACFFSEYFGFPSQSSFHQFLYITITYHPVVVQ